MTIQATRSSRSILSLDSARDTLKSRRNQAITAVVLYAATTIAYFGLSVLPHLGRECVCLPGGTDPSIFMWTLQWWPHAVLHGMNPFLTSALFVPNRVDVGASAGAVPGAALVVAPITLLFGPLVSYNLLVLASPVLAGFFAFLLCRYVSGSFAAALIGGYLFGFSPYMLGQMLGHLHLILIFPIPAAVHLTLRLIDGRITPRRFIALMALTLTALLSFSTELALTFVTLGAIALAMAFVLAPSARTCLVAAIKPILFAGALAALVTSPLIYYAVKGNPTLSPAVGDIFGGDALGFLVPTTVIRLGSKYFAAVSRGFTGADFSESGIYLGVPLALIIARYTITRWRLTSTKILVAMLGVVVILLLGSHLHIAGQPTIPLPWKVINHSLVRNIVPARLAVYMFLIVATITALWLAEPGSGKRVVAKWALTAASIAFLVPNVGAGWWRWSPYNPPFFTTSEYRTVLRPAETVLVLPFGGLGMSMLWQSETGIRFRMAGGYISQTPPADYLSDPLWPALDGQVKPNPVLIRSFLVRRHVGAVILGPGALPSWETALAALGLKPLSLGGVLFYRV